MKKLKKFGLQSAAVPNVPDLMQATLRHSHAQRSKALSDCMLSLLLSDADWWDCTVAPRGHTVEAKPLGSSDQCRTDKQVVCKEQTSDL
eukprot:127535-Amphidinium_carterae.2